MAKLLKFEEEKAENENGGTTEIHECPISNVDLHLKSGNMTIYLNDGKGTTYYLSLKPEDVIRLHYPTMDYSE